MSLSAKIFGWIFIFFGLVLIVVSFLKVWWVLIYGVPPLVFGIWMILNKSEDEIEKRKDIKNSRGKK